MSDLPAPDALQFDKAELEGAATLSCKGCARPIDGAYYKLNEQPFCDSCRAGVVAHFDAPISWATWAKVLLQGGGAALLGTILYFAVRKLTGYELGLIAIGVGLLVGNAVRKSSGARGGWKLQAAAILLTYASISASYMPLIYDELVLAEKKPATTPATAITDTATPAVPADPAPAVASSTAPIAPPTAINERASKHPVLAFGLAIILMFALSATAPFLAGPANFMGWIIIGIALHQAWKSNRRPPRAFAGPYQASPHPPIVVTEA